MGQVINTNTLSLLTQNNLSKSQSALNTAIQRLSSGLRINSAKDDAAGQAIANRFNANIKGLTQAQRNANDGISLAQTTEGALNEVNNNLQRIRELAVQAANGSNSSADKISIQAEITQRLDEIDRTSLQTDFNGVKVLSANSALSIQVGANDGEQIDIALTKINADTLGLTGFNVDGQTSVANSAASATDLLADSFIKGAVQANLSYVYTKAVDTPNTAATSANVFSTLVSNDTVAYTGTNSGLNKAATANLYTYDATSDSFSFDSLAVAKADAATYLTPAVGGSTAATVTIGGTSQNILIASNGAITAADDNAVLYLDATGNLTKTNNLTDPAATLNNLTTAMSDAAGDAGDKITVGTTVMTSTGAASQFNVVGATISASGLKALADVTGYTTNAIAALSPDYTVTAGGAVTDGGGAVFADADGALSNNIKTTVTTTYYAQTSGMVTDNTGAQIYKDAAGALTLEAKTLAATTADPLKAIDAALSQVDELRGALGAVQNRFDSVISNLGTTVNNLVSSMSRIQDADYATEVSNMTRAQILQQAGTSVLAKANQSTQGVMALLQ